MKNNIVILLTMMISQIGYTQNYKFGKVSKEELEEKYYAKDSTANAVYLYKKRRTFINREAGGGLRLITEVHERVKLYNQEGFDWATKQINLYDHGKYEESASSIKGVTYNLVDGSVEQTKLNKKDIFKEVKSEYWYNRKFTMPNLKEGAVVEWSYKVYSPIYWKIDDMTVQYEIPVKKYTSKIELLDWFRLSKKQKGYYPFKISETTTPNNDFKTRNNVILIQEDHVPALKEEPYVNNIDNYRAALKLEVSAMVAPEHGIYENYATSWEEIAKDLYYSSNFGGEIKKTGHLKEDILLLKEKGNTVNEIVFNSLEYVKSKIKWNGNNGKYPEEGVRKAFKEGSGNIADINLTLVAVLREMGLDANPVLVSTRSNGIPIFPTKDGINYIIAVVKTPEGSILLDASEKYSLPNVLPLRALNWNGIVLEQNGTISTIPLESSNLSEEDCILSYKIEEDGFIEGVNRVTYKNMESINYRNNRGKLDEDDLISKIEEVNDDIEIVNFRLSNKEDILKPIVEMYTFEKEDGIEIIGGKMYLEPLLFETITENPFKLESRLYPVDFGTPWKNRMVASIQIPEGYKVESIPESIGISFGEDMGKFVYSVVESQGKLKVSSIVEINDGIVTANYYSELKEFYKIIVSKQTEKIVLSKI